MNQDNTYRFSNPLSPIEDIHYLFHWVKLYPNTNLRLWIMNDWSFISNDFDGVPLYRKKKENKFRFKHTMHNSAFTQTNSSYLRKYNKFNNISNKRSDNHPDNHSDNHPNNHSDNHPNNHSDTDNTPLEEIIIDSNDDSDYEDQYRVSPLIDIKKKKNEIIELKHNYKSTQTSFFDKNFSK
jgi:hypothetical protein